MGAATGEKGSWGPLQVRRGLPLPAGQVWHEAHVQPLFARDRPEESSLR